MKKVSLGICLIALVMFFGLVGSPSYASTEGLLTNKQMETGNFSGYDFVPSGEVTTDVTDGDDNTFYHYYTYGTGNYALTYTFSNETTISAYKLLGGKNIIIRFMDSAGQEISRVYPPVNDGTITTITPVEDVKEVNVYTSTSLYEMDLFEVNLYNDSQTAVPEHPTSLNATVEDTSVLLSWDSVNGADTYTVKRSEISGGPYTTVSESVYGTSYEDSVGLINGKTYYYVVVAVNDSGESENSNEATATILVTETTRALLVVTMENGIEKEYDLTIGEVQNFISWYEGNSSESGTALYTITKDYNHGPFLSRKDYLVFDKIVMFEVNEYISQ